MIGRLFATVITAFVISAMCFAINVIVPQTFVILEPVFCRSYETMEIQEKWSIEQMEFPNIETQCTGDGDRPLDSLVVYGVAFLLYFMPIWSLLWLRAYSVARRRKRQRRFPVAAAAASSMGTPGRVNMPSVTVTFANANPGMAAETVALVREAMKDGVITNEEFDQIFRKINGVAAPAEMNSLSSRLTELQDAFQKGLITQTEYDSKRREILGHA